MVNQTYFKQWYGNRGLDFVIHRAANLLARYHLSSNYAYSRAEGCVNYLTSLGSPPSLPTPGIILKYHPKLIRRLQDLGAEITVHGYQHLDFRHLKTSEAIDQLVKARQIFEEHGIPPRGFRCPYLGWSEGLIEDLPAGLFDYSSNETVFWPMSDGHEENTDSLFVNTLKNFYRAKTFEQTINLPHVRHNFVEIRVSIPDDLQLFDGLKLNPESVGEIWVKTLTSIHERGEHFNLMFHPELASLCEFAFTILLNHARQMKPPVWLARLCEISDWWNEKKSYKTEIIVNGEHTQIKFTNSPRATILVKGLPVNDRLQPWEGEYYRFQGEFFDLPDRSLPFVGIAKGLPERWVSFLEEQGYILYSGEDAVRCNVYLKPDQLLESTSELEIIRIIETTPAPMIRFWRWPDGAKCAFSLTGDLDALSLLDYASRLFVH